MELECKHTKMEDVKDVDREKKIMQWYIMKCVIFDRGEEL